MGKHTMAKQVILWVITAGLVSALKFPGVVDGQVVKARVTVEATTLPSEEQTLLMGLPSQLEDYINTYEWADVNDNIEIECTIHILVETYTTRGADKLYLAQFLISSPSGENFRDQAWQFLYQPGQAFDHQRSQFDPLLDMVDYYINLVIAGELDTYILLGGTPYYNRALTIANQGTISLYARGWTARLEQVKLITDGDHVPLRQAKYYYYDCLYYIEAEQDEEKARELSRKVVDLLEQVYNRVPNSVALKRFLDAHYQEFCNLFVFDENRNNVRRLISMDPSHRETYEECL